MGAPWSDGWVDVATIAIVALALVGVLCGGPASYAALAVAAGLTLLVVRQGDGGGRTAQPCQDGPVDPPAIGAECWAEHG